MVLEDYIAQLNSLAFWKEFTFAQNKFAPRAGEELELADNLVWLGSFAFVLQLKQRLKETNDPEIERTWFQKKVLGKAMKQVRDTLRFLEAHENINITNERGHSFDIRKSDLSEIVKIVVFQGGRALPEDCWRTRHHVSQTAGFVHIVATHDYLGILETLRVPEDIRRYFCYRENVLPKLAAGGIVVDEPDIMGAFLMDADLPTVGSHEALRGFVQDLDAFDLSGLIGNLHDHIEKSAKPYDYYRIMLEFARVPRSVWREIKLRVMKSIETVQKGGFARPFRLSFPATDCTFVIVPLDGELQATGADGERLRVGGLENFTYGAMYELKTSKGVGIVISKDGEYFQIDWALLDIPWKPDPEMDARLAEFNPFRETREKKMDSFLFSVAD